MNSRIVITADVQGRLLSIVADPLYTPFVQDRAEYLVTVIEQALSAVRGEPIHARTGETAVPDLVQDTVRSVIGPGVSLN